VTVSVHPVALSGATQARLRYAVASAPSAAECQPETQYRTCQNGSWSAWSGSFQEASCLVNGCPALPETRIRFAQPTADYPSICLPEVQYRSCEAGVPGAWSGSFSYDNCVNVVKNCGATTHGQSETRVRFREAQVAFGKVCESQQQSRICINGELTPWGGTYTQEACEVTAPAPCNGSSHGSTEKRVMFAQALVPNIGDCVSEEQTRSCFDGKWSSWSGTPSFESAACRVQLYGSCNASQECSFGVCEASQCHCAPHEEPAPSCTGADCCVCSGKWTGEACDVCPGNWDPMQNCSACRNHWDGAACTHCSPRFDAASDCAACSPGFSGPHCETEDVCVRYVDPGSSAAVMSGLSWGEAFKTIDAARNSVAPLIACQYWLKAGSYPGNVSTSEKDSLYGGFAGTELSLSQRNPAQNLTVINGPVGGSGLSDGVTIRKCDSWPGSGSTLHDVHFEQGARLQASVDFRVERSTFLNANQAITLHDGASLVLQESRFSSGLGPFIYAPSGATASVEGCTFVNGSGAVLEVDGGTVRLRNNLIAENQGIFMFSVKGGVMEIVNSTVVYNTTSVSFPVSVFRVTGSPAITATNNIFWGDAGALSNVPLSVTYSIVEGGYAGTGNVSAPPVFTGLSPHPYQLDFASAGIDAANGDVAPKNDLTGHRRIDTTYPNTGIGTPAFADIGAYEWHR
jgi:hypothetical protein